MHEPEASTPTVVLHPHDLIAQAASIDSGSRPVEGDLGNVRAQHLPPASREPERVGAFAATDVEGASGRQVGDLVDENRVGLAAPKGGR